jgi:hypothetical protein
VEGQQVRNLLVTVIAQRVNLKVYHCEQALPFEIICPQCHRLFTKELEDKEFIGSEIVEVPGEPASLKGETRLSTSEPYFVKKEVSRYKYHYKCKHCGHEWTEMRTQERNA